MRVLARSVGSEHDQFATWVLEGYETAFRTAFLILHDRADAEDAVQDAFLRAWRFRSSIPPGEGVRPWLYRVVVNACLSRLRSDRARRERTSYVNLDGDGTVGATVTPDVLAETSELRHHVVDAVARLPEHLRVVIVLRYYSGLSEKEIASVIHRRTGTVKSRVHDAKARLARDPGIRQYQPYGRAEATDD